MSELKKITIWYSIQNGGDGSAYPYWYLTQGEADIDQERMYEGWGEPCLGHVETFEGSDIHQQAILSSQALHEELRLEKGKDPDEEE